jgi:hypothetical protein
MINVYAFLSSLKLSWLRRCSTNSSLKDFILDLYPGLDKLNFLGGEFVNILLRNVKNFFWTDVLKHFKKLQARCPPADICEFNAECLFYNYNITVGGHIVYNRSWLNEGIF